MEKGRLRTILRNGLNLFYILAFSPLLFLMYYRYVFFNDILGSIIPLWGFLILLMKKDKFAEYLSETKPIQKILSLAIIACSFLVYYPLAPFIPDIGFYGIANYAVYLLGLVLFFFEFSGVKQSFSALFIIVASGLAGLTFQWIEYQMTPTVPYYVSFFSLVLRLFGFQNTTNSPTAILLYTTKGPLQVLFESGCIGIYSVIIFSIIIVVTMLEVSATRRTKLLWSVAGVIGVFLVNILRLLIVVASMYQYGFVFGQRVHQVLGYVVFLSWLTLFLFFFAERKVLDNGILRVQRKIRTWL